MDGPRALRRDELVPIHAWWAAATDDDLMDVAGSEAREIILDLFATIAALTGEPMAELRAETREGKRA